LNGTKVSHPEDTVVATAMTLVTRAPSADLHLDSSVADFEFTIN
jgi:hypothetical protein